MNKRHIGAGIVGLLGLATGAHAEPRTEWHFTGRTNGFTAGGSPAPMPMIVRDATSGRIQTYDEQRGYGCEPGPAVNPPAPTTGVPPIAVVSDIGWSNGPFSFSMQVPEGNYRVKCVLGGGGGEDDTAVKAESRRVLVPLVRTKPNETKTVEFTVNVHTPQITGGGAVKLNDREKSVSVRSWDDKLTLEFCGQHPAVASIDVQRVDDAVTVFLAGDSTVCDQPEEPWAAWGQFLPQFFGPNVAIANYAESGRTLRSFKAERRWDKLLSQVRPGDYVLIQFGHNDMKETGPGVGAFTSFSDALARYVADVRGKGGLPVLLTPMHRRRFAGGAIQPTFGDYPEAVRRVAKTLNVPLIDLQAMTKPLYEAFGPERSKLLFVHFPAGSFAGQTQALKDDTHFRAFGADQIARCVVQGMRDLKLPLAGELRQGIPPFDPAKPDDPAQYELPASAAGTLVVPEGH